MNKPDIYKTKDYILAITFEALGIGDYLYDPETKLFEIELHQSDSYDKISEFYEARLLVEPKKFTDALYDLRNKNFNRD